MFDSGKVIVGLVIFVGLATSPFWYGAIFGQDDDAGNAPDPILSATASAAGPCVHSAEYMKASHMDLINEWRDRVVRGGERIYEGDEGREYVMSLTNGCLSCHDNKTLIHDIESSTGASRLPVS